MAIDFKKYIDITSVVGAGNIVEGRELIGRLFTENPLVPTNSYLEFTSAADVGAYFGTNSTEYFRAVYYFGFVSKQATRPQKISYARWNSTDVPPTIYGAVQAQSLATYQAITDGSIGITIGLDVNVFTGINFSTALSLADVASILEAAIQTAVGTMWTASTVQFIDGRFVFTGGDSVAATISVQDDATGTPIAGLIGWLEGAILSDGALAQSVTDVLQSSYDQSNNFGSFLFIPVLSIDEATEAAEWTSSLDVELMYMLPINIIDSTVYYTALQDYGGTGVTISETSGEYPEQLPMMIFASTDYQRTDASQNYMFQTSTLTPSVTTTTLSNTLDSELINYYGQAQQAGQDFSFYQRGVLFGLPTSPRDMNVFANEIWLKDSIGVALMNLLLGQTKVSANTQGSSQIKVIIQNVIDLALNNGTISVGKPLNQNQILFITEISGDENAWRQVQTVGYWLNVTIDNSGFEPIAVYTLIYSKDDDIRKIVGSDILI